MQTRDRGSQAPREFSRNHHDFCLHAQNFYSFHKTDQKEFSLISKTAVFHLGRGAKVRYLNN